MTNEGANDGISGAGADGGRDGADAPALGMTVPFRWEKAGLLSVFLSPTISRLLLTPPHVSHKHDTSHTS